MMYIIFEWHRYNQLWYCQLLILPGNQENNCPIISFSIPFTKLMNLMIVDLMCVKMTAYGIYELQMPAKDKRGLMV